MRIKTFVGVGLLLLWAGLAPALEPERSVVQIFTFAQQPAWDAPWRFEPVRRLGGSGFVIQGKRILTNAHVVSWGRQILVRRYQDPHPYVAEVEYVGHDCDLAVLTVSDPAFFDNLQPLEFGPLPKVRSAVTTCGYPAGGEEISFTKGVVSRIELEVYAHSGNRQFLGVQTDAAINPGNSGGPVFQEDKVVGVAFQGMPGLENAGFFIPLPVVEHFLKDIQDGRYDGFPQAGIRLVPLQNPAFRSLLKLPDNDQGARIDSLSPVATAAAKVIESDDVLLQVGDFPVASDGTILYQGNRVSAALGFQLVQSGESVPLKLWRKGCPIDVTLPMSLNEADQAAGSQYDVEPKYLVYGGLVFTPLSMDYLRSQQRSSSDQPDSELFYELFYHRAEHPDTARSEPVVLASVLADSANANVAYRGRLLVDRINGVRIENMQDVARAFDSNTNAFDTIEFCPHHSVETLERAEVLTARPRILKTYNLTSDRRL